MPLPRGPKILSMGLAVTNEVSIRDVMMTKVGNSIICKFKSDQIDSLEDKLKTHLINENVEADGTIWSRFPDEVDYGSTRKDANDKHDGYGQNQRD